MARKTKTTSSENTDSTATTTPVVAEQQTAPVAEKTKKPRAPKAPKAEASPAPAEPKVEASAPVAEEGVDAESTLATQSVEFLAKLTELSGVIASLKSQYKALEKQFNKEIKVAQKANSKRKRKSGNRAPSGFIKPTKISDELAGFLGKEKGTEMARTDVTREINNYIRTHNLQDKENGRKINPDKKLQTLLKVPAKEELTYFNLQKYMSPHFFKSTPAVKTA